MDVGFPWQDGKLAQKLLSLSENKEIQISRVCTSIVLVELKDLECVAFPEDFGFPLNSGVRQKCSDDISEAGLG